MKKNILTRNDNEGKIYRRSKLYTKIYDENNENKYQVNIAASRSFLHVGYAWHIFATEKGLSTIQFVFQFIFFYIGPTIGINDDLFD